MPVDIVIGTTMEGPALEIADRVETLTIEVDNTSEFDDAEEVIE